MARERGIRFGGPDWAEYAVPLLNSEVEQLRWHEFFDKVYAVDVTQDEADEARVDKQKRGKIVKFQQKVQEQFGKRGQSRLAMSSDDTS